MIKKEKWQYIIKWTAISLLLASLCGSVIALYLQLINQGESWRKQMPIIIILLPAIGALCTYLYERFQLMRTVGNDWLIAEARGNHEPMPLKTMPIALMGTVLSHWFGASIGREDMASQITGTISLHVTSRFRLTPSERQTIAIAAMASAFVAAFGTPIAGTIFALEVIKEKSVDLRPLFPVFMTSFLTLQVTKGWGISYAHYHLTTLPTLSLSFIFLLLLACFLFALCGKLYHDSIQWLTQRFLRLIPSRVIISVIGGALVVAIAFLCHKTSELGLSVQMQREALTGKLTMDAFLWKGLLTVISVSCGFRGGSMTPIFDIGASLGYTVGTLLALPEHFMASLGFVGVFAAATNTPLASFILGIELFGSQGAIIYFMVALFSYIFSSSSSLFKNQMRPSDMI